MNDPLIVTAEFGPTDFAFFEAERRAHFPPERNVLAAHLTLFHALPPSVEPELKRRLAQLADSSRPEGMIAGVRNLGRGVAYSIESRELNALRNDLAQAFAGCLTSQDAQGWRAHVTIQNKVEPRIARELFQEKDRAFVPRPVEIAGLALHRYKGGPWVTVQGWPFRRR